MVPTGMKTLNSKQGIAMKNVFTSLPGFCLALATALLALAGVARAQIFYISEGASGIVSQVPSTGTPSALASVGGNVQGITTGSTGTIYVANGSTIKQITSEGTVSTFATYTNTIGGLTMSSGGTLYGVSMAGGAAGGHAVGTYASDGTFTPLTLTTAPFAPFYSAQSVRFDNAGNIFVTNASTGGAYANSLVKLTLNGTSWDISLFATFAAGFAAYDVAFDASNNVFVSSGAATATILKYSSSGVLDETFSITGMPATLTLRGLTYANDKLYAVSLGGYNMYEIDPTTGVATAFNTSYLPDYRSTYIAYSAVPEPSGIGLVLAGGLALFFVIRLRKSNMVSIGSV